MADPNPNSSPLTHEEEHFRRLNQELIEKRRAQRAAEKAELEKTQAKEQHWMRCPKCGQRMEEIELEGIKVDRCTNCSGIYFDAGELEMLTEAQKPESFIGRLGKWMQGEA